MALFDVNRLMRRCNMPTDNYWGMGTVGQDKYGNRHVFIDRGGKILAVGHLDSVQKGTSFAYSRTKRRVYSPRLDDRLGVYVILDLLPKFGVVCDVLLTENEEMGASTAADFVATKEYNWIFEFDRGGTDVVMYSYEDAASRKLLNNAGFKVGYGSYSDISVMQDLGVKGFNFGVAYYDYHSANAYCKIDELELNIYRFLDFYDTNKDVKMPHTKVVRSWSYSRYDWDYDYNDRNWWKERGQSSTSNFSKTTNGKVKSDDVCPDCGTIWYETLRYHTFHQDTGEVTCNAPFKSATKIMLPSAIGDFCWGCDLPITVNDRLTFDMHGLCAQCFDYGVPSFKQSKG